ncbi:MAG: ABC transporter permease [Proteobacteria bacterium]|nr:ABC transporter permease [Pseudomonadota bacterium]MBU1639963.1 ABC transporter permease [Pseudomonadota bacterium]
MSYISFIFGQLVRNSRHGWTSQVMTLFTVSLSVLIFSFFFLIYINMQKASSRLGNELRLIVYLEQEVPEAFRQEFKKKITDFDKVDKIVFISREEAFERLTKQLGRDSDVLEDLDPSFLPYSVEIFPSSNLKSLTRIKDFSDYLVSLPGAVKVQYGQDWIERFGYFISLLRIIVILSGALLILTSVFMVSYTIRLTLESRQEELEILRFLGATDRYIRGPVIVEGFLLGLFGACSGLLSLFFLFQWIKNHFSGPAFMNLFELSFLPLANSATIFLISLLLCSSGSLISIRKYLKV